MQARHRTASPTQTEENIWGRNRGAEAKKWVRTGASEGEVLEAIFSKSEVFKGIFLLIDVEISAVVLSMAHWSQGNIEPYFRLFPVLCQIVAALSLITI